MVRITPGLSCVIAEMCDWRLHTLVYTTIDADGGIGGDSGAIRDRRSAPRGRGSKGVSETRSLSLMQQAIVSLSEIHTNIIFLITDLEFPISDWDEKRMDAGLQTLNSNLDQIYDESIKLLYICIAFSYELSRLNLGQLFMHYATQLLEHSSIHPSI
ncbi:UPF0496 protein 4-like [Phalaenopsis equestris]|uniref:UPF0496 protein 4-like n=1 Tax=Phalaenopsis equestris TaxID=78828 RepID=UPI0009E191A3|nr:UPF0496 protein 4-like [Phalaenopsis equestris]